MNAQAMTSREDFDYWVSDMDDGLERFLSPLPRTVREDLNLSPASLDTLEKWLLDQYPSAESATRSTQSGTIGGAARYIGEAFRHALGGYWDIELNNPRDVYFGMPVLTGFEEHPTPHCPLALATAAIHRRTGMFLRTVLENDMKRLKKV